MMEIWTSKIAASARPACRSARSRTVRSRSMAFANASWSRASSCGCSRSSITRIGISGTSQRRRYTGPTTIPGEAGIPVSMEGIPFPVSGLAEVPGDERGQRFDRLFGIVAVRPYDEFRAALRGEHHHAHDGQREEHHGRDDALPVDLEVVSHEDDVRREARSRLHD